MRRETFKTYGVEFEFDFVENEVEASERYGSSIDDIMRGYNATVVVRGLQPKIKEMGLQPEDNPPELLKEIQDEIDTWKPGQRKSRTVGPTQKKQLKALKMLDAATVEKMFADVGIDLNEID